MNIFEFETKCRKCLNIFERIQKDYRKVDFIKFATEMINFTKNPIQWECPVCNKSTVQDIVSYTSINDLK